MGCITASERFCGNISERNTAVPHDRNSGRMPGGDGNVDGKERNKRKNKERIQ